jgi:hypothetical protein
MSKRLVGLLIVSACLANCAQKKSHTSEEFQPAPEVQFTNAEEVTGVNVSGSQSPTVEMLKYIEDIFGSKDNPKRALLFAGDVECETAIRGKTDYVGIADVDAIYSEANEPLQKDAVVASIGSYAWTNIKSQPIEKVPKGTYTVCFYFGPDLSKTLRSSVKPGQANVTRTFNADLEYRLEYYPTGN